MQFHKQSYSIFVSILFKHFRVKKLYNNRQLTLKKDNKKGILEAHEIKISFYVLGLILLKANFQPNQIPEYKGPR